MLKVVLPLNALIFFQTVFPVGNFDFLQGVEPYQTFLKMAFVSSAEGQNTLEIDAQTKAMGYETRNPYMNLRTLTLLMVVYWLKLVLMPILYLAYEKSLFNKLGKKMFYGELIILTMQGYLEFAIAG